MIRINKNRILSAIIVILLIPSTLVASGWKNEDYTSKSERNIDTPYEYPVKPGSEEWDRLPSVIERREVSNIPKEILEKMTTEALVETVITYPLFSDVYAFDTFENGIKWISQYYNGIEEIEKREDAVFYLEKYCEKTRDRYRKILAMDNEDRTENQCLEASYHTRARDFMNYLNGRTDK